MSRDDGAVVEVSEVQAESRFVITVDGQRAGLLDYEIDGDVFIALHTEVDPAFRGRGLAETLVRETLDRVAASGRRVRARCPYVRQFLTEHPSYAYLTRARPPESLAADAEPEH